MKYPIIKIPGKVCIKNNNPVLGCVKSDPFKQSRRRRACDNTFRPGVLSHGGLKEADRQAIALFMRRSWGLPPITGPVNFRFRFYIAEFPPVGKQDLDNTYKGYQDIAQEIGVIKNDSYIQGHDGSRFVFLCNNCKWGLTGTRRQYTENKEKKGCPGSTKCPDRRVEIFITDMTLGEGGFYEINQ